ncbi:MAG: flagellar motor switch protein FliG [Gammaproteobacteria bacterium]|jgi:flagellar motor switch protein FliG
MSARTQRRRPDNSGSAKAARFLMVMGESGAANILKHLTSDEVQKIGVEMARMKEMSTDEVNQILASFLSDYENDGSIRVVADEYTRSVLERALGPEAAKEALDKIMLGGNTKGLDSLKWMEPQLVAGIIQNEHPQIQAIVISYLGPELSGEVLTYMPENSVVELMIRMAEIDTVDPTALQELNNSLEKQVEGVVRKRGSSVGGIKNVADIFNSLEKNFEESLMEKLTSVNEGLATAIQEQMFVFDDLKLIPSRDFQALLREVSTDKLAMALKGADEEILEKVMKNMSSRAAEIFKEDMEEMGPVKIVDVETAQKEVLSAARKLADDGKIELREDAGAMVK